MVSKLPPLVHARRAGSRRRWRPPPRRWPACSRPALARSCAAAASEISTAVTCLRPRGELQREAADVGEAVERLAVGVAAALRRGSRAGPGTRRSSARRAGRRACAPAPRRSATGSGTSPRSTPFSEGSPSSARTPTSERFDQPLGAEVLDQQIGDELLARLGALHQELRREVVAVAVHHQPGQQVGLAVDHPVGGLVRARRAAAQRVGGGDARAEEVAVDRRRRRRSASAGRSSSCFE